MTTTRTEGKTDEPREQKDTNELLAMKVKAETLRNSQQQEDCYVHETSITDLEQKGHDNKNSSDPRTTQHESPTQDKS